MHPTAPRGARADQTAMGIMHRFQRITVVLIVSVGVVSCHHATPLPTLTPTPTHDHPDLVARGEYIVRNVAACGGCHSATNDPDGPLSGGTEFKDWRLGTVRASNLTPDTATGLGAWSDAEVVRAIRNGVSRDGRLLAPVMPYSWLHDMSDEDALAVARYLRTLPPAHHEVKQSTNFMFTLGKLFVIGPAKGGAPMPPPPGLSAAYGGYLAQHVGLCADCHTPRTGLTEKPRIDHLFAGDAHPSGAFPANPANLTPDSATGIGRWSEEDFVRTIRTGVDPHGDTLASFMPWHQNRRMADTDLRAIYQYLRTIPPILNRVPHKM